MDILFAFAEKNNIEFVSLRTLDQLGRVSELDMTFKYFLENYKDVQFDDVQYLPDVNNFFLDPFRIVPTVAIMCNTSKEDDGRKILLGFDNFAQIKFTTKIEFDIASQNNFENDAIEYVELVNILAKIVKSLDGIYINNINHSLSGNTAKIVFCSDNLMHACDDSVNSRYIIENTLTSYQKSAVFSKQNPISIEIEFDQYEKNYITNNVSFFQKCALDINKLHVKHNSITIFLEPSANVYFYLPLVTAVCLNNDGSQQNFLNKLSGKFK